ncbi:MAG: XrtA system polysaccharide chain length determinant [Geminicoccaceae bacterium]
MHDALRQLYDYLDGALRWRWLGLATAWVLCVLGWFMVSLLPNTYESEARVFADTDSLLGPLMRGITVETDLESQIDVIQETLLSRPNVERVIDMADLGVRTTSPEEEERLIERMQERIRLGTKGPNLYTISYTDKDRATAQRVVQSLLTIFIEGNLGASRRDIDNARRFIDAQIKVHADQLDEAEDRLARFKEANVDVNAGGTGFFNNLQNAKDRVLALESELDAELAMRDELENQLQGEPQTIVDNSLPASATPTDLNTLSPSMQLALLEERMTNYRTRYTEQHPSVQRLQRRIDSMREAGIRPARNTSAGYGRSVPNPIYEQIKVDLVNREATIASLRNRLAKERANVADLESKARTVPAVEAELRRLTRDYEVIRANYEELVSRREAARIAEELETTTDKVDFQVIDPPTLPLAPSGPPRLIMILGVLIVGLGAGGAVALMMGQLDGVVGSAATVHQRFGLAVIGGLTLVLSRAERWRRRFSHAGFVTACVALVMVCAGLLVAEHMQVLAPFASGLHDRAIG